MSSRTKTISKSVQQLSRRDPKFKWIDLHNEQHTDAEVAKLADCLLAHPDVVTYVNLGHNRLTDETGVKLARYVAASSTIESLGLYANQLGEATCLALAAALQVNTSLQYLDMSGNPPVDQSRIDAVFVTTLRLNPNRPVDSKWWLYAFDSDPDDFKRLKKTADALGPLSMLEHLAIADE